MFNIPDSVLPIRYTALAAAVLWLLLCSFAFVGFGVWGSVSLLFLFLVGLGIYDLMQPKRSVLRNYPIIGHMRFLDRKSTRLNSSHPRLSRMPSSA